ncbi:MAG TPA: hypothetical protein VJN88_01120 [Ktedonobacterales bacterium]|nr:hypothetical protein [Ktedonobacterales bacterium]
MASSTQVENPANQQQLRSNMTPPTGVVSLAGNSTSLPTLTLPNFERLVYLSAALFNSEDWSDERISAQVEEIRARRFTRKNRPEFIEKLRQVRSDAGFGLSGSPTE